jgi:hypothetical protein
MYVYNHLEPCTRCGNCCSIPGIFLPEQIAPLAAHFNLRPRELFEHYLIVQMRALADTFFCPSNCAPPVFVLSPVKVDMAEKRLPQRMADRVYDQKRLLYCTFFDQKSNACVIQKLKPFECCLTACSKMTKAQSLYLEASFYYHKWKDCQELIFSILPELRPLYKKLEKSSQRMRESFERRNRIIRDEIAPLFDGHPHDVPICI